ncbi:32 kDa beta-galactoside-binding lectin-like isoform X1 [Biomphalaria glabrata]|uniref:Galectin n=2 Tax=Biomphalaria glabrata TaxID=6526 RepID=A0A9W2ZZ10_BIOGL|nr:32 kDa beta-galactoside-binding lectin-like isoform X1 [Biomphalaria glabrata]KAI8744576.1 galectin-4 [Biomphalaria glabrata]
MASVTSLVHRGHGAYEPPDMVNLPFSAHIPGGLIVGTEIIITGRTDPKFDNFSVNLCYGHNLDSNTPLHFNPRFGSKVVVRTHRLNGKWQTEERSGGFPFAQDSNFEIRIEVKQYEFAIYVNHLQFCTFKHHQCKESVQYIYINGQILIHDLQLRGGQVRYDGKYSQPTSKPPEYSPYPTGVLSYPVSNGPIMIPPVPFTTAIPGEVIPGRLIFIKGAAYSKPTRFTINLACGPHDSYNFPLHFDVRFAFGSDRNQVVRTHKQGGSYATEERHQEYFPFFPSATFELMILVEKNSFKIAVNNKHFTEFIHRILPIQRTTHVMVLGDVQLHEVRFQ